MYKSLKKPLPLLEWKQPPFYSVHFSANRSKEVSKYLCSSWRYSPQEPSDDTDTSQPKRLSQHQAFGFPKMSLFTEPVRSRRAGNVPKRSQPNCWRSSWNCLPVNSQRFRLMMGWLVARLQKVCMRLLWLLLFLGFLVVKSQMSPTSSSRSEHLLPS